MLAKTLFMHAGSGTLHSYIAMSSRVNEKEQFYSNYSH